MAACSIDEHPCVPSEHGPGPAPPVAGRSCQSPVVAIVIVNFRTAGLTIDCLRSVAPEVGGVPGCRVIVVENGSGDDSAARIRATIEQMGWQDWASCWN